MTWWELLSTGDISRRIIYAYATNVEVTMTSPLKGQVYMIFV